MKRLPCNVARDLAANAVQALILEREDFAVPDHAQTRELARWVAAAAIGRDTDLDNLLARLRAWHDLVDLRAEDTFDAILARFAAPRRDPERDLRTFLVDAAAADRRGWYGVTAEYPRVVSAVVALGGSEEFLLERCVVLAALSEHDGWGTDLKTLLAPHRGAFDRAIAHVWPTLPWARRASVTMFFSEHELPMATIAELLLQVDGAALGRGDRTSYLEALDGTGDPRARRRRQLLTSALADLRLASDAPKFRGPSTCAGSAGVGC